MDRSTHWTRVAILGCMLIVAAVAPAFAGDGKITGTVKDSQTGEALISASIVLEGTQLGTVSDDKGRYFILNVPPGTYTLRATYVGYASVKVEEIRVSGDLTTTVDLKPRPEAIQADEVIIRAERPIIDKNATNAVRIVGAEDLEILPFRGVQNVLSLQAGVVEDEGALHIRGSRADEIAYYVEGASVRNVVTGNSAVILIDEAIQELQLQAGGFNAEYGGANAGIILQELRTGGTDFKVSILSESDGIASEGDTRFGTHSYGYSNQVLTISGPVAGNDKIRAFVASQRRVQDYQATYWDGFQFDQLTDSGDRGGRTHWTDADGDGTVEADVVDLKLQDGNIQHTGADAIDVNGTLVFDFEPVKFQITGLYSDESLEFNPAPIRNMLNTGRLPEADRSSSLLNFKATHLLDPSMFYEVNFSLYSQDRQISDPTFGSHWWVQNDSFAVANANPDWAGAYTNGSTNPAPYDLSGFPFNRPGTPTSYISGTDRASSYVQEDDTYWGIGAAVTKQTDIHEIKAGFDYQSWTTRRYSITLNSIRSGIENTYPHLDAVYDRYYAGQISEAQILNELIAAAEAAPAGSGNLAEFESFLRNTSRADYFGYDVFGREDDASGLEAPRHPTMGAAFIQDKIEYNDLIVNAGLRIDYFDVDSWRFKDPESPSRNATDFTIDLDSMQKTRTFTEFSPRLGFSFPVSDRTVFHVQYGRFSQMPALRSSFTGGARLALELGGQNLINNPSAFDLEPMRTTQYELGFEQQFSEVASFDITGFYRDVKGQLQIAKQELSTSAVDVGAFNYLQNGDFATTKGLEFVLKVRRVNRIRAEMNYTLSDARGTGSSVNSAISGVENDNNLPTVIAPLDFNETHRGNLYVDYRFGANEGGPVLKNAGANMLLKFTSGHNYTLSDGSLGQRGPEEGGLLADDDPRQRKPVESVNRSKTPWTFEIDLRLDKGFSLFGSEAQVYTYVQNLLNRKNEINVFSRTGNAEDDGFLTNPEMSGQIVEASGGLAYTQLYQAINLVNRQHYWYNQGGDILGEPRQIRFGLKFSL